MIMTDLKHYLSEKELADYLRYTNDFQPAKQVII